MKAQLPEPVYVPERLWSPLHRIVMTFPEHRIGAFAR